LKNAEMIATSFAHPLANISHSPSTSVSSNLNSASLPNGNEMVLDDCRFIAIGAFSRKNFISNISKTELAELGRLRSNCSYYPRDPTRVDIMKIDMPARSQIYMFQMFVCHCFSSFFLDLLC
jgi:hypothetical protein